jgi:hypothetical protein
MNHQNYKNIFIFMVGGLIFYLIYVVANILQNPALAAIITFLPISLFCCYFMESKIILRNYLSSLIYVILISLSMIILGYLLLPYIPFHRIYLITFLILLWLIIQYTVYMKITSKNN